MSFFDGKPPSISAITEYKKTPPIDSYFLESLSTFTISADMVASGIDAASLVYTFTATPGHGIAANDEIILLDVPSDRSFYAKVFSVAVDTITVDRPIDFAFPSVSTQGRIVNSEMAVDGSVTPRIFSVRAGNISSETTRFILRATNTAPMDYSLFAGIAALQKGLVFRVVNGYQKTIFNFHNDGDIAQFCYDLNYSTKAPAGENGYVARISFAGDAKHGTSLVIEGTDTIQWVTQDNLTTVGSLKASVMGRDSK
jgi:hypothetical protein